MFNLFKKNVNKKIFLPMMEVQIVDNCNLKCNKCSHFSHLIKDEIMVDVNDFEKDLVQFCRYFNVRHIKLLGGEPLLHPEINKIIEITRKYLPKSIISITSNGLLLKKMSPDFWDTLRANNIFLELSKYPVLGNSFSELLDLIDDNDVHLLRVALSKKFSDTYNPEGNSNPDNAFNLCRPVKLFVLFQHKLYPCIGAYRYYRNKIKNENAPLPPSIDIYNTSFAGIKKWAEEIKHPYDACKYCDDIGKRIPWEQYKEDN